MSYIILSTHRARPVLYWAGDKHFWKSSLERAIKFENETAALVCANRFELIQYEVVTRDEAVAREVMAS